MFDSSRTVTCFSLSTSTYLDDPMLNERFTLTGGSSSGSTPDDGNCIDNFGNVGALNSSVDARDMMIVAVDEEEEEDDRRLVSLSLRIRR